MLIQRIHQIPDVAQADILCPLRESGVKTAARMPKRADALMPVLLHPGERLLQPLIGIRLIQDGLDPGAQRLIQGIQLEALELDSQLLQAVLHHAVIAVLPQDGMESMDIVPDEQYQQHGRRDQAGQGGDLLEHRR